LAELCTAFGLSLLLQMDIVPEGVFGNDGARRCLLTYLCTAVLHGQQQCALGFILPTLIVLKKQLIALQVTSVEPLSTSLSLECTEKHFTQYFQWKDCFGGLEATLHNSKLQIRDGARRATCT